MKIKKILGGLVVLSAMFIVGACDSTASTSSNNIPAPTPVESTSPVESNTPVESITPSEETPTEQEVLNQDFSTLSAIQDKPGSTPHGTVYLDSSANGSASIEGDSKYAKISGATADTTMYIELEGLDNGTFTVDFDFSLGGIRGSWTFFQMFGSSEMVIDAEVFGFRTTKDNDTKETYFGYRVDKNQSIPNDFSSRLTYAGNIEIWHHASITVDISTGNVEVKVTSQGVEYTGTIAIQISKVSALKFMAKGADPATSICVDNVVIKHTKGKFSEVKAKFLNDLETAYTAFDLTKYTTNGAQITEAYNTGLTALNTATDFTALNTAYSTAIAAMNAIKSDATLAAEALADAKSAAKTAVKTELDTLKATYNYTADELASLTETYTSCISAIEETTTVTEATELIAEAIAVLRMVSHTGTGEDSVTEVLYTFNASDLEVAALESGTFGEIFTIVGLSGKSKVTENSKTMDDIEFTKRFQIGGKTIATAGYITFTVDTSCELVVYAMSGSSGSERPIMVWNSLEALDSPISTQPSDGTAITKLTTTLEAGTYYIGSTAGAINIYGIYVTVTQ